MSETWKLVPTADPQTWSFVVKASTLDLRPEDQPKLDTPYEDIGFGERKRCNEGWGKHIYKETRPSQDDGMIELLFVKPLAVDANSKVSPPIPFRSSWNNESGIDWPPVLERLPSGKIIDFTSDNDFPFSKLIGAETKTTPRILVDWAWRERFQGFTRVRTDIYLSPVPWGPTTMDFDKPLPQPVQWNQTTTTERFEACLHGEIVIPAFGGVTTDSGDPSPPPTTGKVIPATNMVGWQDRWIMKDQQYVNGQWVITFKWAIAPDRHPITTRLR